jgi:CDP-diacylglycerol--serine O-phosphatidyltransferase
MKKSWIPNAFTFLNLSFGILAILATLENNYILSSAFIILAALVDRYDGRVARVLKVSSDLGKELDSLADLVSFGVAPSILVFLVFNLKDLGPSGLLGVIILLTFPICGAFRLARYNATTFEGIFTGVPITVAGSFMALFVLLTKNVAIPIFIPISLMFICSYLMVSKFKLKKF